MREECGGKQERVGDGRRGGGAEGGDCSEREDGWGGGALNIRGRTCFGSQH